MKRTAIVIALTVLGLGRVSASSQNLTFTQTTQLVYPTIDSIGVGGGGVAIADLDQDGRPDIIVADQNHARVLAYMGQADGSYTLAPGILATAPGPVAVDVADLNRDGHPDIAVASYNVNVVSILLGHGDGTFEGYVAYNGPYQAQNIKIGDLNNDDYPDILATGGNQVRRLLNNGDGTFASDSLDVFTGGAGDTAIADFNRDGNADFATAGHGLNIELGIGGGAFAPVAGYGGPYSSAAESIAIGDFNEDGQLDLVVAEPYFNALSVELGNGDGTFALQVNGGPASPDLDVPCSPHFIAASDFNLDGHADVLMICSGNQVKVLPGMGDGSFGPAVVLGGVFAHYAAIGDLNGDGLPDVITSDGWIFLNTTPVTPADTTPPGVTCQPADGQWHSGNIGLGCTANDDGSGLADAADASFSLVTSIPAGAETANAATGSRTLCDVAGNCAAVGPIGGNMIDRRAPTISLAAPANAAYTLHQVVLASFGCADGGSGVSSCAGSVANGSPIDTSTVGIRTFTVNTTDAVGNSTSTFVTYTVSLGGTFAVVTPTTIWLGLKNSDDVGTKFDLLAEVLRNGTVVGSGQSDGVSGGSSGFNNAAQFAIATALAAPTAIGPGDILSIRLSVRIAVGVSGHRSGTARLWLGDGAANSRVDTVVNGQARTFYLTTGSALSPAPGTGPRATIDVLVDRLVGGNAFKPFGTWSIVF